MKEKAIKIIEDELRLLQYRAEYLLNEMKEYSEDYTYYKHEYLVVREQIVLLREILGKIQKLWIYAILSTIESVLNLLITKGTKS